MPDQINGDGQPQPAGSAGGRRAAFKLPDGNGPVGRSVLDEALSRVSYGTASETNNADPQTPREEPGAPEAPQPGGGGEGEETAQPGGQPEQPQTQEGGDGDGGDGAEAQPGDGGEEPPKKLDDNVQAMVDELAAELAAGNVNIGEIKRVGELLRQRAELRQERAELESRVRELETQLEQGGRGSASSLPNANPFANLKNDGEVRDMRAKLHDVLDWADANPAGGTYGDKEYSEADVAGMRRDARRALDLHLPERSEQLRAQAGVNQARQTVRSQLAKAEAWAYDKNTDLGREAQRFMATPELAARPDGDILGAALALGLQELRSREAKRRSGNGRGSASSLPGKTAANGNGNGKPAANGVARRTGLPAGGAAPNNSKSKLDEARKNVLKHHDTRSMADFLEAAGPPGSGWKR